MNSQSKFHSRKGEEFSVGNKWKLVWENRKNEEKGAKNKTKSKKEHDKKA